MAEGIFFSVIIPTYNRAQLISKTIASVLKQQFRNFEVIIVDDGSTDDTEKVIHNISDNRIHYFRKENRERAAARNFGSDRAKGEYLTFLDSDDLFLEHCLKHVSECLIQNKMPPFFRTAFLVKDDSGKILFKNDFVRTGHSEIFVIGNPLSCLGVFIKREVFQHFKFNEDKNLTLSEDWELWLRLSANYGLVADNRISAAMVYHKQRSVSKAEIEKLATAKNLAIKYAFEDVKVQQVYGKYRKKMEAFANSYIALHSAIARQKEQAWKYLSSSLFQYPPLILSKRFFVVLKNLIK